MSRVYVPIPVKALWVIDFAPSKSFEENKVSQKPYVNIHIYKSFKTSALKTAPMQMGDPLQVQANDFLRKIQDMCIKITEDCRPSVKNDADFLKRTHLVKRELGDLDDLIRKLNEILRWFMPPEGQKDPPSNPL